MTQSNIEKMEGPQTAESPWYHYANQLDSFALRLLDQANIVITEKQFADPRILSFTLLCRTLLNFKGVITLAKLGLVVEARTLTRCCYENFIWVSGLVEGGDEFAKKMKNDDLKSARSRLEFIRDRGLASDEGVNLSSSRLNELIEKIRDVSPKASSINLKTVLKDNPIEDLYLMYKQLSADAAHPSMTSLRRHLAIVPEGGISTACLYCEPPLSLDELESTLQMTCSAVLGVCAGVCLVLRASGMNTELNLLITDYEKLSQLK